MIQKSIDELHSLIQTNIKGLLENYDIKLLYIFGSYAKGKNDSNSDLDIAILLNHDYNPLDKLSLISEFTSIFKRDDIDLVVLNSTSPVLRHEVIKYGKVLYMEDENIKVNFEVRVLKEYMDMEPFRRVQTKSVEDWIEKSIGAISKMTRDILKTIDSKMKELQKNLVLLKSISNTVNADNLKEDMLKYWGLERGIQISIECVLDIANIIISSLDIEKPDTYRESILLLHKERILTKKFSNQLANMVSFRNILVHDYAKVDENIMLDILKNHLDDFIHFMNDINTWIKKNY